MDMFRELQNTRNAFRANGDQFRELARMAPTIGEREEALAAARTWDAANLHIDRLFDILLAPLEPAPSAAIAEIDAALANFRKLAGAA